MHITKIIDLKNIDNAEQEYNYEYASYYRSSYAAVSPGEQVPCNISIIKCFHKTVFTTAITIFMQWKRCISIITPRRAFQFFFAI